MNDTPGASAPFDAQTLLTARHWQRIGTTPRLGVAAPVFSLRTERSAGVGDAADLERLVDWCVEIGASVVQLLPLNDLGPGACPYGAISAFANDPLLIALDRLPEVQASPELRRAAAALHDSLEGPPRVLYPRVRRERGRILEAAFERRREALDGDADFQAWVAQNAEWLEDFALYRALREAHGWRSWEDWGPAFAAADARRRFAEENAARLQLNRWMQYEVDRQLVAARRYANERGVLLKGDIPILVGRDSADVWRDPQYFRLDTQAGAPPDYFSADGQIWGFPTYDWDALWRDDCRWWRRRLAYAERFYDLYRIDHVVGLFRIWTCDVTAKNGRDGHFVPPDEARWGEHGRRILEMMIEATGMLPIAEDLGVIPPVCRQTLSALGICGTKVIRWEREWDSPGQPFIPPQRFSPLSMATLSVHDSETLRGWWQDYPDQRQAYWEALGHVGEAPRTLPRDVHEQALRVTAAAGSSFVILALQDLLEPYGLLHPQSSENRVNVPGTVADTNWSWRLPFPLERLLADGSRNEHLRALLARRP
jgi:4-alpha-glucanotransferase